MNRSDFGHDDSCTINIVVVVVVVVIIIIIF